MLDKMKRAVVKDGSAIASCERLNSEQQDSYKLANEILNKKLR